MIHSLAGSLLLLFSGAALGAPLAAQADDAARLVPADATVLVRFQSVQELLDLVHAFGPVGGEPLASLDAAMLLGGLQLPGDPAAVDARRPFFLALALDPGSRKPALTWIAPVTDAAAFRAPIMSPGGATSGVMRGGMKSAVRGNYVGLSMLPDYAVGAAPSPLVARLRPGVVSAHVDLAALLTMFRPLIDMMLKQAETSLDSMPADAEMPLDVQPVLELYLAGARTVLDSAQSLGFALERRGDELAFLGDFTAKAGSELDGWESTERTDLEALAGFVDPAAPGMMLLACDWPSFYRRFSGFLDAALSMYPEPFRSELQRLIDAQEEIMGLLQPGMAASFDLGSDGIQGVYALRSAKPKEVVAAFEKLASEFVREQGWIRLREPGVMTLDGIEARTWKVSFDWRELVESMAASDELPEKELRAMQEMFDQLYGKDLRIGLTHKQGVILFAFGSGEGFLRASLARLRSPKALGARLEGLIGRTGGGTPSLVYHLDFGRLMGRITGAMGGLQPRMPGPAFQWPDGAFAVDSWGAIRASTWSGGVALSLQELTGFVQAVRGLEVQPK